MNAAIGYAYLLHIDPPFDRRAHYFGWSSSIPDAIGRHWSGRVHSGLVRASRDAGHRVTVARVWNDVEPSETARLRRTGSAARYCPTCRELARLKRQDERMGELLERSIEEAECRRSG